jgi:hypothetical protein
MIVGTLSLIDVPDHGELREDTHQVFVNDHFFGAEEAKGEDSSTAEAAGSSSGQHGDFRSAVSPRDTFFALLARTPLSPGMSEEKPSSSSSSGSLIGEDTHTDAVSEFPTIVEPQARAQRSGSSRVLLVAHHRKAPVTDWARAQFASIDGDGEL